MVQHRRICGVPQFHSRLCAPFSLARPRRQQLGFGSDARFPSSRKTENAIPHRSLQRHESSAMGQSGQQSGQPEHLRRDFERRRRPQHRAGSAYLLLRGPMRIPFAAAWIFVAVACAQDTQIVVISHRGEHLHHPENTIPAFRAAIEAGADFIEVDVRTTADGKLVLMHDESVDRCTNGHGEVAKMTFDEIRKLDAGAKSGPAFAGTNVPTFQEVLQLAQGRIGVYIDAKQISAKDLVENVGRHGMDDHVVVYGSVALHREVRKLNPRIRVMPEAVSADVVTKLMKELTPRVIAFDARDFRDEVIAPVKRANLDIYVDRLGPADTPQFWEDAVRRG